MAQGIKGTVIDSESRKGIELAEVFVLDSQYKAVTDADGNYSLNLPEGKYRVAAFFLGRQSQVKEIQIKRNWETIDFSLTPLLETLDEVKAIGKKSEIFNVNRLNPVEGTLIYEAREERGYFD